jgi:hypothetical protein
MRREELKKEQLLDRIERNGGWIDHIDAFQLLSIYIEEFGVIYTALSIDEELSLIYYRLKGYEVFEEDFTDLKVKKCIRCGIEQRLTHFGKNWNLRDGRTATCKICHRLDPERSRKEWEEKEKKKSLAQNVRGNIL